MGIYDDLLDPNGGRESRSAADSLGLMAMDFGFGLFGKSFANALGRGLVKNSVKNLRREFIDLRRGAGPIAGAADGAARRGARTVLGQMHNERRFGLRKDIRAAKGFGKTLSNIGWIAGAIGLMDLAMGIGAALASPSIGRDLSMGQMLGDDELMMDTRMAYTQRQRAIQAIHDSQMSVGRALIGQEAQWLHK